MSLAGNELIRVKWGKAFELVFFQMGFNERGAQGSSDGSILSSHFREEVGDAFKSSPEDLACREDDKRCHGFQPVHSVIVESLVNFAVESIWIFDCDFFSSEKVEGRSEKEITDRFDGI